MTSTEKRRIIDAQGEWVGLLNNLETLRVRLRKELKTDVRNMSLQQAATVIVTKMDELKAKLEGK